MKFGLFLILCAALFLKPNHTPAFAKSGKKNTNSSLAPEKKASPAIENPLPPEMPEETKKETPAKNWEVRTSPIAMLVNWYTIEPAIHFKEHWALGPTFTLYAGSRHPFLIGLRGTAVGFFTTYYLEAMPASGWYLALRLQSQKYTSYPASDTSTQVINHVKGSTAELLAGYRYQMANNFFILGGAGLQRQHYEVIEEKLLSTTQETKNRVYPYLEAKLGLDF